MAIATLAYKITADTRGLTKGVSASRRELNLAKRVMQETETPADRLRASLSSLEQIHKKGLLTSKQYAAAQLKVKQEIMGTTAVADKTPTAFGKTKGALQGMLGPLGLAAGGFGAISKAIGLVSSGLKELDALAKQARVLGFDINELRAFQQVAKEAGIPVVQFDAALGRMVKRLGDAALGGGPAKKALEDMGLSASELVQLAPDEAFLRLTERISQFNTQSERMIVTTKVFGDDARNMVNVLALGRDVFEDSSHRVRTLLGVMDPKKVEEFNSKMEDASLLAEGFRGGLAEGFAEQVSPFVGGAERLGVSGRDIARAAPAAVPILGVQTAIRDLIKQWQAGDRDRRQADQAQLNELRRQSQLLATDPPEVPL